MAHVDMDDRRKSNWRKSSRSGNSSNCVEVALGPEAVGVRDSKDPTGPHLNFTHAEWIAFLHAIRTDTLNPD